MIHQAFEELKKSIVIRPKYDNFIGGEWVPPVRGQPDPADRSSAL